MSSRTDTLKDLKKEIHKQLVKCVDSIFVTMGPSGLWIFFYLNSFCVNFTVFECAVFCMLARTAIIVESEGVPKSVADTNKSTKP